MSVVIDQLSGRVRDSSDTGIIITDAQLLFVWLELEFLLFYLSNNLPLLHFKTTIPSAVDKSTSGASPPEPQHYGVLSVCLSERV